MDEGEIAEVNAFINDNLGQSDYDTRGTANALTLLNRDGKIRELAKAADFLNDACSAQDKVNLLDFAYRVVTADGAVSSGEEVVFLELGKLWDIDMDSFLAERQ